MSVTANSVYALVQVLHNFGAVAVVGSPMAAWMWTRSGVSAPVSLAWLTCLGWVVQVSSGIGFAITSYLSRGELPEIEGVALFALGVKMICAVTWFVVSVYYLKQVARRHERESRWMWPALFGVGAGALIAAAFLRWFG